MTDNWRDILTRAATEQHDVMLTGLEARQVMNAITAAEAVEARVSERLRAAEELADDWARDFKEWRIAYPVHIRLREVLRGDQ